MFPTKLEPVKCLHQCVSITFWFSKIMISCYQILGAVVDGISQNKSSWTPLWVATYAGHEQCVKILLENGASLEAKSPETPLFVAAREGKIRCLQYLIEHGANVNVIDKSGQTPLHAAAFENRAPVAKELVCYSYILLSHTTLTSPLNWTKICNIFLNFYVPYSYPAIEWSLISFYGNFYLKY